MVKLGGGNYAQTDMTQDRVDGVGFDAPLVVPISDDEAALTDQAVRALEPDLHRAVHVVYVEGGKMARKAQKLGVSEATVYLRIDQAHRRLSSWFSERARAQQQQRLRVEALQASVRPTDVDIGR